MKTKITFVLLFIGYVCFAQTSQDSITAEKKKEHAKRLLELMIKRKEEAERALGKKTKMFKSDSILVDDKAIFEKTLEQHQKYLDKL